MPKKVDPTVKERCVQQMLDHVAKYPNPTAAAQFARFRMRLMRVQVMHLTHREA